MRNWFIVCTLLHELFGLHFNIVFQSAEIAKLKEELKTREEAAKKMIDQMEELHENLAELDARFERSEEHNQQLREEKIESQHENEQQMKTLKEDLVRL